MGRRPKKLYGGPIQNMQGGPHMVADVSTAQGSYNMNQDS